MRCESPQLLVFWLAMGWKPGPFDWWTVRCASHHNVPTYINVALVHDVRHQKQQNQHSKTWQGTPKKDVPWHFRAKSCLMFMNFHRYEVSQHHISASEDLTQQHHQARCSPNFRSAAEASASSEWYSWSILRTRLGCAGDCRGWWWLPVVTYTVYIICIYIIIYIIIYI
jgi:hypothetical protein